MDDYGKDDDAGDVFIHLHRAQGSLSVTLI